MRKSTSSKKGGDVMKEDDDDELEGSELLAAWIIIVGLCLAIWVFTYRIFEWIARG